MSDTTPELPAQDAGDQNPDTTVGEEVPPEFDDDEV